MPNLLESLKSEWLMGVESESKEPLYHRLYRLLRKSITNGTVAFGAQMPTEQQLSEAFDVSRITVKRAMDDLAVEKLIARRRGKGSHVTYQYKPEPVKAPLVGMLENLAEMGKHSIVKVLSAETMVPPAAVRKALAMDSQDKAVKIVRVRSNEDAIPYAYYVSWTLAKSKRFTKKNIEAETRLVILKKSGILISKVEQTLGAENADSLVADKLDLPVHTALLSLTRHSFDQTGKPVDILYGLYNPKMFTYKMVLEPD